MAVVRPEQWRRTGRQAGEEHFLGLNPMCIIEFPSYDDGQHQQGNLVLLSAAVGELDRTGGTWLGKCLAVQDGYYEYWLTQTHGPMKDLRDVPLHLCSVSASRCGVNLIYRDVIHVDVFRMLPGDSALRLGWLSAAQKTFITEVLEGVPVADAGFAAAAGPGAGAGIPGAGPNLGGVVQPGAAVFQGLAAALGGAVPWPLGAGPALGMGAGTMPEDLEKVLKIRVPRGRVESALQLPREKKQKKRRKKERDSSSSDSDGPDFRIASLPEGVERLLQIHEQKPGALANYTLQRYREILDRSTGGEANMSSQATLPAVARAYLTRVYFQSHHPQLLGQRNAREMRTLMTIVDLIFQNDGLRALDVALQRQKSLELQFLQGNWEQGQQLELVPLDEDHSYFKQELKAAQQEVRSTFRLAQQPWKVEQQQWRSRRPRGEWWPARGGAAEAAHEEVAAGEAEAAPLNGNAGGEGRGLGRGGKGKKGRGKGLKGKLKGVMEKIWRLKAQAAAESWSGTQIAAGIQGMFGFLGSEEEPSGSASFRGLKGLASAEVVRSAFEAEVAEQLSCYKGIRILLWHEGWTLADGGVYVGRGTKTLARSVFQEAGVKEMDPAMVHRALDGRPSYELRHEVECAHFLIDEFQIRAEPAWSLERWHQVLDGLLREGASVCTLGVVLKDSAAELKVGAFAESLCMRVPLTADELAGVSVAMVTAQEETLKRFARLADIFCEGDVHVPAGPWHQVSENLGDMYTGREVCKAYKLSWAAIESTLPVPGAAARVDLAAVVPEDLKPFVENPELLRMTEEEVLDAKLSAAVLVESDQEYDPIVSGLVSCGIMEAEVEEETVRHGGVPVYNGMFGVRKGWELRENGEWIRLLRLIINLIPTNALQRRLPRRPSTHMAYAPMWGRMVLLEDEVALCFAEDQRYCFHIYRPGRKWRAWFVVSKLASGVCFGGTAADRKRPRVCSAPMGWKNIVDFIQVAHEGMGMVAGVSPAQMVQMGMPLPQPDLKSPLDWFSFYVDNFDQTKVLVQTDRGLYEGRPSEEQLKLREVYKCWDIDRAPKKATGRAWVQSREGSRAWPLGVLFDELYKVPAQGSGLALGVAGGDELLLLSMSLPLRWLDQRTKLDPRVYATDASLEGAGACVSYELSPLGEAKCHMLACSPEEELDGRAADAFLAVEHFGGMGGLKKALDLLGIVPMGVIFIDNNAVSRKLSKFHCAFSITLPDVTKITKEDVLQWRRWFPRVTTVINAGGWPGVNHSRLNAARGGAGVSTGSGGGNCGAQSSELLDYMLQIAEWLRSAPGLTETVPWKVVEMYENVVMDWPDLRVVQSKIGAEPFWWDSSQLMRCRRPRLLWLKGLELVKGADLTVEAVSSTVETDSGTEVERQKRVRVVSQLPPLSWFLEPGARKLVDDGKPFASFMRPIKRQTPPEAPAGLSEASEGALRRWRGDNFRLPPYQFEETNLVKDANGVRRSKAVEQIRMLGYNSNHFAGFKPKLSEDEAGHFAGNSFPVITVARCLAGLIVNELAVDGQDITACLWGTWNALEERALWAQGQSWSAQFGPLSGGLAMVSTLREAMWGKRPPGLPVAADPSRKLSNEEFLLLGYCRIADARGTDVRLDTGMPFAPHQVARSSVDPASWRWKVVMSYAWKETQHINVLETVAVLDLLRKLGRESGIQNFRRMVLIDNQAALGVIAKGRSSSRAMMAPLRRISALLVAGNVRLVLGWVCTDWNPADGPSRWVKKRVKKLQYCYPSSVAQLDALASVYVEHLWEEGEPKCWAGDTLSGLGHFFPACKPCLNGSWRLHAAWGRAELPARAMPLTALIVYACAQLAFQWGWAGTAVLLCLGFHRFPRSGELFSARVADFQFGPDCKGVWALPLTKSGQRVGAKESVVIEDPWIGLLIRQYCRDLQPGDLLTKVSPGVQRVRLAQLIEKLKIVGDFRWYSLRRGGATHLFRITSNTALVCQIGRWGNVKTARIYLTDGLAQLTELNLSGAVKQKLLKLALQ
ncbi:unnamed protein product, partial [Polarella glacialis]